MFIFFFALWVIFNGTLTPEIAAFGAIISAAVYAFTCFFMDFSIEKDIRMVKRIGYFAEYVLILVWEIIKANLVMIKNIVIKQEYELKPVVFTIKTELRSKVAKVLLSNAITLTPGTITISIKDNELVVHAVDESLLVEDDGNFIFEKILLKLEKGGKK